MERLFEDDVSNSREVRLEGSGKRQRVRPERQVDTSDSRARRRRRQRHGVGSHRLEGSAHPRPEGRRPSADARARHRRRGERRPARGIVARRSLSASSRLAIDGGGRVSRRPWRPARRPIYALRPRDEQAGVWRDVAKDGRYGTERRSKPGDRVGAGGPSNRSVVAVAGNRPALGATAQGTKWPVDPRAERRPATNRSGAGSLR
jgi:hypothetical protein